jgi:hypothetical protein
MTSVAGMCFQLDVQSTSGYGAPMIVTQLSDAAGFRDGWLLLFDSGVGNVARLYSVVGGTGAVVASSAAGVYAQNATAATKMCTKDGSQRVWLNGQLLFDLTSMVLDGVHGTVGLRDGGYSPYEANWDNVVVPRANDVSVAGLPVGYKFRIAGLTSAAATGSAEVTLDLGNVKFPASRVEILDANNVVVKQLTPADGVWGGDEFSFAPTP